MANIEFPDLDNGTLVGGSIFATSQPRISDPSTYESKKVTAQDVGNFIASTQQYTGLDTTAKTLIGAINEAAQGGGGGASALDDLSDVSISSPQVGQILEYAQIGQNKKWTNTYPQKPIDYFPLQYDDVEDKYYIDVEVNALVVFGNVTGDFVCTIGTTDLGYAENPSVYFFSGSYWDGNVYNGWHVTFSRIVEDNGIRKMQYLVGYGHYNMTYFDMYEMELFDTKEISGTLTAGSTSITLSDAAITSSSTIEIFTEVYGVSPTAVSVSNGSVTMTFEAQASNMGVKVRVS